MAQSGNIRSAWISGLAGFALLSIGDSVIKSMAGAWPGTGVAALRFSFGAIALGGILWFREGAAGFRAARIGLQAARGAALAFASLLFFLAIFAMPLAEATAIQFVNPMLTALLSLALFGERIGRTAWAAIVLAFAGVLIVLRPNVTELGWAAALPLAAALFMAAYMILNRRTQHDVSPLAAQFFVAAFAAPVLVIMAAIGHKSGVGALQVDWPSTSVVARCALVAVSASVAHSLVYRATMRASAAMIAPTVYVQIIAATVIGIIWFGDWPDTASVAGTMLIIGAGLWLWRSGTRAVGQG